MPRGRPKGSGGKNKKSTTSKIICQSPTCEKAGIEQPSTCFYNTNSSILPKYPVCKKCLQKIIDKNNMQSIYKVLKEMDIPFIQNIWDIALEKNPENPFGKLITMTSSLPQYRGMRWCDSVFERQNKDEERNENGTIYSLEWCGTYSQKDLKYLDDYLSSLQKDFKIVTRNHIDYARKIAKASLAMDKAYEDMLNGGSESKYKTIKEIFDSLSKSAQFAESQRGVNDVSLGNFGVVFDKVEKHMWIPPYHPEEPDIYDKLIDQFSNINKSL